MSWSADQRDRLAVEKRILDKYFPGRTRWIDPTGQTKVEVNMTSNSNVQYLLRVYLTVDFPNACPRLAVVSPKLYQRNGEPLPECVTEFHTLESIDQSPTICHFQPLWWTQDNTLFQVFMKGRVWLEAYEAYRSTGKRMDSYLREFNSDPQSGRSGRLSSFSRRLGHIIGRR